MRTHIQDSLSVEPPICEKVHFLQSVCLAVLLAEIPERNINSMSVIIFISLVLQF